MSENKIAIYITCDANYVIPSIVSLKSFCEKNKCLEPYIFTSIRNISEDQKKLVELNNIKIIDFIWENNFTRSRNWPKEAFWFMKGPEYFFESGYSNSLYVDADVLCLKKIDFDSLIKATTGFSGTENKGPAGRNFSDQDYIHSEFNVSEYALKNTTNPNTGFLFFNNQATSEKKLWNKFNDLFDRIKRNNPNIINADQALFALLILVCPDYDWNKLDYSYNFRTSNIVDNNRYSADISNVNVMHFTGFKPWKRYSLRELRRNPLSLKYRKYWFDYVDKTEFSRDLKKVNKKNPISRLRNILLDFFRGIILHSFIYKIFYNKVITRRFPKNVIGS
jgi:lipopolysaccharide biosynthesis glycosyltransferase